MGGLSRSVRWMMMGALLDLGQTVGLPAYGGQIDYKSHNEISILLSQLEKDIPGHYSAVRQVIQEFKENLTIARTSVVSPIKESHLRHIKAQAQKRI
jgi:hypothetical protein